MERKIKIKDFAVLPDCMRVSFEIARRKCDVTFGRENDGTSVSVRLLRYGKVTGIVSLKTNIPYGSLENSELAKNFASAVAAKVFDKIKRMESEA